MNLRSLLLLILLPTIACAQSGPQALDRTEADWQAVLALEAGPRQSEIHTREQAQAVTLAHLAKQETSLGEFLKNHPLSSHTVDVQLRLAQLHSTRSDLTGNAAEFDAALQLLADARKTAPEERQSDLDFARIALLMHRVVIPTDQDRERLTAEMLAFKTGYPNDFRLAGLMVEIATLYDAQPERKKELLTQALAYTTAKELRARIVDDLKRLSLLGHIIEVKGTTARGVEVDLAKFRGKVTLVCFFASWSAPSLACLDEVEHLRKTFAKDSVEVIGVSLDPTSKALEAMLKPRNITWPVLFDGKGWKSPLVRGLAINAIPTLWIVDRQGNLRTLNARTGGETLVRQLLQEP